MSRLKKFWALSGVDKKAFLKALYGLPVVTLQLRFFGFNQMLVKLQQIPLAEQPNCLDLEAHAVQISSLVNGAAHLLFRREACLERSVMLWTLLRHKGIHSELKIGVAHEDNTIRAHAWVEIDGEPINEMPQLNERFSAFNSSFTPDYRDFS